MCADVRKGMKEDALMLQVSLGVEGVQTEGHMDHGGMGLNHSPWNSPYLCGRHVVGSPRLCIQTHIGLPQNQQRIYNMSLKYVKAKAP